MVTNHLGFCRECTRCLSAAMNTMGDAEQDRLLAVYRSHRATHGGA